MLHVTVAMVLCVVCAGTFYLASAHQKLLAKPLPPLVLHGVSAVSLVAALVLLNGVFGPATAVYFLVTMLMLLLTVAPLVIAYLDRDTKQGGKQ